MIVTLSTGEEVHFADRYTRKAQRAYNLALGMRYHENDEGKLDLDKEVPLENFNLAAEAAMEHLVTKVKKGEIELSFTREWLDDLSDEDFDKLVDAIGKLRSKDAKDKKK